MSTAAPRRPAAPEGSEEASEEGSNVVHATTSASALADGELVRRALDGDTWAEEMLYRRHVRALWGTVLRLLGDKVEAEDVVQDTFVRALNELRRLREPSTLRAWLLQIAVREVHRRLRRRRLRRLLGLEDGEAEPVTLESIATEALSPERRAELSLVDRVLARVPAPQRIAWLLRHVEGESLEEVARACGCSLATAKRRIASVDELLQGHVQAPEVTND